MNIYKSHGGLSVNIILPSGSNYHVRFDAMSNGQGLFSTSNDDVIWGLERHSKYGKWFVLDRSDKKIEKEEEPAEEKSDAVAAKEPVVVEVGCLADAKDYLANEHHVLRTKMKSKEQILKAAESCNVTFVGELS